MDILVDPTLLLTRRGRTWVERANDYKYGNHIATSAVLLKAVAHGDVDVLDAYQPPWFARKYDVVADLRALPPLQPVENETKDLTSQKLHQASPSGSVVADLWAGLQSGGCLAARRPITFDLLVQADIRISVEGREAFRERLNRLMVFLHPELVAALARRTRFLAQVDEEASRPTLSVCDVGRGGYR